MTLSWTFPCGGQKTWPLSRVFAAMFELQLPEFGDGWDDFPEYPKPLTLWFRAMWAVTSKKNGASAIRLQCQCRDKTPALLPALPSATWAGTR